MAVWYLASYWVKLQQVLCYAEYYDTLNYTEFSKTVDFLPVLILLLLFFFNGLNLLQKLLTNLL